MEESRSTIFDDVFRTMCEKTPRLLIPVINEIFATDYTDKDLVLMLNNEHMESEAKIITDNCVKLRDKYYHLECQSKTDGSMVIRMLEYDFMIALEKNRQFEDRKVFEFPQSAVIYLRHNKNTEDKLSIQVRFPDGFEHPYEVPVIKVKNYSLEQIIEKNLLFFAPYYLMRYETHWKEINQNEERKHVLIEEYMELFQVVNTLNAYEREELNSLICKIVDYYVGLDEEVREEVKNMGGKVLEFEHDILMKEWEARGRQEGRKEGRQEGLYMSVYQLEKFGYKEHEACEILQADLKDYQEYKRQNHLDGKAEKDFFKATIRR